jgi:hypothetical protein
MTDLQPTTTATGGRSAKVAALAAFVVLAGVIYVGATGSSSTAPAATGKPAPSLAVAAASAVAPPATPLVDLQTGPVVPIIDHSKPPQYQYLGMALGIGGQEFTGPMTEVRPGFFSGGFRIRLPAGAPSATLALSSTQATVSHESLVPIGHWEVPLTSGGAVTSDSGPVLTDARPSTVVDTSDPLAARILSKGFRVTARLAVQPDHEVLTIEVAVMSEATFPIASYSLVTDVAGEHFTVDFFQREPGRYTTSVLVPDTIHDRSLTFHVMVTPQTRPGLYAAEVTPVRVSLSRKDNFHPTASLIGADPDSAAVHRSDIFGAGYSLEARTRLASDQRLIDFTLTINPTYSEAAPAP